jgi:hypothetical protein
MVFSFCLLIFSEAQKMKIGEKISTAPRRIQGGTPSQEPFDLLVFLE